ncbi:prenyltransferase/squalene oxidase repeat-containing protein [Anatilimnocola floriformis]|uniref:prenyltransferase/squalene oxidase repeat-containing protein n=1 Tax=Anatilimnocola floriformis TaxID=2948575 RepID=UPI0020C241FB|nr:prenyltransferase/squalene oxidase repeat-containing protein [Anatilimnocola floriformis]
MLRRSFVVICCVTVAASSLAGSVQAQTKTYDQMVSQAIEFLATKSQAADGSYNSKAGPAVTALVTAAILKHGRSPEDPHVAKALKYLEGFVQPDGGFYAPESNNKNYETALGLLAFSLANKNGKYDALLKKGDAFVKSIQWGATDGKVASDVEFGGAGYGRSKRPDLSNTSFFLDALKATGNDENSEAIKRALIFVSRCQNLETEHNTTPFAAKKPDGGFYYTPAAGGSSQAGVDESTGALRSYASMSYAGLKSMIYAGVKKDDARVVAAKKWLAKNYDLKSNPGMGQAGLYYYYNTMAKALEALGEDKFVDEAGVAHDWRKELVETLAAAQQKDGSWVNETNRWMEGDSALVTGYVLLALSHCKK